MKKAPRISRQRSGSSGRNPDHLLWICGWNARATAYYNTGDFGPSIADIGHVLTLNPRHFGAMAGLAAIFEELDRPEQALEVYRAALSIHPQQPDVLDAIKRLESDLKGQDL